MSDGIYLNKVRLSFPKLIEAVAPTAPPNAAKKFGADFILAASHPDLSRFMEAVGAAAAIRWKEQAQQILTMIQNDRRLRCWGNGSEKIKKDTLKPYEGYEGMMYITGSMNEDRPPTMIFPNGDVCDPLNTMARQALARKLYGGCYVNAMVSPWVQDNQFGRAIRCNIHAVQFCEDGTPFGDSPPDMGGFGAVQTGSEQPAAQMPGVKLPWM